MTARKGFTLIELLIVVVIISILAAIAIAKFSTTKEQAYVSNMRSDLRNLATAEEAYWNDQQTYYAGALPSASLVYGPSPSVAITIVEGTNAGWSARSTHPLTGRACAIFMGSAAPVPPATAEGKIACT